MTVTEAVHRAVPVFAAHQDDDEYIVREALVAAGIPAQLAADVVDFLPIAVARAMLNGMGVRFADNYVRQTAQGQVVEEKLLADEPVFQEGTAVANELSGMGDEVFLSVVRRSPEYRAISKGLDAGRRPDEMECPPPTMIASGDDRRSFGTRPEGAKPWWRFWK